MINVLLVCAGNICRSPMADAILRHMVNEAGLGDQIHVDSAGTGSWYAGEQAHPGTLEVLRQHRIPYNGRARQIDTADLDRFHYVLAMDRENLTYIMRLLNRSERSAADKFERFYGAAHRPEIALFLNYANRAGTLETTEVPDPYYDGRFSQVYDLIYEGCEALLNHICEVHGLVRSGIK